ncbi:hypothetical protein FA95DRAFT_1502009 [Auriscalpium vulgare]|uniref:Uncharacterized protein n=1 Tax=Auriscalpium vulgare TaxID=40419 RepID=A0ACB8RAV0_9AGAM|nr:hypothetical protein FA95DRAFT_1502009 [Auriscalpium vulgare]
MAPPHAAHGRAHLEQPDVADPQDTVSAHGLFLEPMMGTPMPMYVQKDVDDRDAIVELITKNGGVVSQGYSGVQYILVDPHKESGQNLYRQYAGKKTKIVLDARWVRECVKSGVLQNYSTNFAGCKVTGNEQVIQPPPRPAPAPPPLAPQAGPSRTPHPQPVPLPQVAGPEAFQTQMPQPMQGVEPTGGMAPPPAFAYQPYQPQLQAPPGAMHPANAAGPPQSWQAANGIAPEQTQTHLGQPQVVPQQMMGPRGAYREDAWDGAYPPPGPPPPNTMVPGPPPQYAYPDQNWVPNGAEYYSQPVSKLRICGPYPQQYMEAGPSAPSNEEHSPAPEAVEGSRGRKRTRTQPPPAPPAGTLVVNRRNPEARSPTPPSRVIKSTYGGNLFTADDVMYLKKYIDFCQEQGLVLSLREICERVAIKAPHHTFYSWRRYCNKHQIRLGGYAMSLDPDEAGGEVEEAPAQTISAGPGPSAIVAAKARVRSEGEIMRSRSPTPPRALFRSTTGKGVAFTDEDVAFLIRLLEYKRQASLGKLDMVAFWKEIAAKAPHHSRASWMKFYRRHKHELNHTEEDEPLPQAPEKKMRYSRSDDVLLAKYFYNKPDGTSDKLFQAFGRMHPHHPWKGWQEHHRIHKAKIDHLIQRLAQGEYIDEPDQASEQ